MRSSLRRLGENYQDGARWTMRQGIASIVGRQFTSDLKIQRAVLNNVLIEDTS